MGTFAKRSPTWRLQAVNYGILVVDIVNEIRPTTTHATQRITGGGDRGTC